MTDWLIVGRHKKIVQDFCGLTKKLRIGISSHIKSARRYSSGELDENVQRAIGDAAACPEVAQDVIDKLHARLRLAHQRYVRMIFISVTIGFLPHLAGLLLAPFTSQVNLFLSGHQIVGGGVTNSAFLWEVALTLFVAGYFNWRRENRLAYIGDCLTKAIQCGLKYYASPTSASIRDEFAKSIQLVATRYRIVFKRSARRPYFFAAHVRSVARGCRNDILSLIPVLVTADCSEIAAINCDLARLIIRSQTGYWHQTADIVRSTPVIPKREAMRISILTFIKDRSIQVAVIAFIAALVGTFTPMILNHFR